MCECVSVSDVHCYEIHSLSSFCVNVQDVQTRPEKVNIYTMNDTIFICRLDYAKIIFNP